MIWVQVFFPVGFYLSIICSIWFSSNYYSGNNRSVTYSTVFVAVVSILICLQMVLSTNINREAHKTKCIKKFICTVAIWFCLTFSCTSFLFIVPTWGAFFIKKIIRKVHLNWDSHIIIMTVSTVFYLCLTKYLAINNLEQFPSGALVFIRHQNTWYHMV